LIVSFLRRSADCQGNRRSWEERTAALTLDAAQIVALRRKVENYFWQFAYSAMNVAAVDDSAK
jgi:hypothetical protein